MGKAELEGSLTTLDVWLIVFGIFVAIGVVGESVVGFLHWRRSGQLHALQTAENLAQQAEIGRLSAEAEAARNEIAIANTEAAKANERTAELKLALEREIAAREPRRITPPQRVKLITALSQIAEKRDINVTWKLFDEEAEQFGKQILEALIEAGFPAKEVRGAFGFGAPGQAILLRHLANFQSGPSWVGDVQASLNDSLGLTFSGAQMDSSFKPEAGDVLIVISSKAQ